MTRETPEAVAAREGLRVAEKAAAAAREGLRVAEKAAAVLDVMQERIVLLEFERNRERARADAAEARAEKAERERDEARAAEHSTAQLGEPHYSIALSDLVTIDKYGLQFCRLCRAFGMHLTHDTTCPLLRQTPFAWPAVERELKETP